MTSASTCATCGFIHPPHSCQWTEDEDGKWYTHCDHVFEFILGGPEENQQRYCGYCGGMMVVMFYAPELEEESQ